MEEPRVLVFSDGRVVARAARTLTLAREELNDLVGDLRELLAGYHGEVDVGVGQKYADGGTAVLTVREPDSTLHTVSAYGLQTTHDEDYPEELQDAMKSLVDLGERTVREGSPYRSDTVRLIVGSIGEVAPGALAWPDGVAIPEPGPYDVRVAELTGAAAQRVINTFPFEMTRTARSPLYTLPDGTSVRVGWRYLVPGEHDVRPPIG